MKNIFSRLIRYFFQGLLLTVPLAVTIAVIYRSLAFIDELLPGRYPGLGILLIISSITILGAIGSSIIIQPFLNYFDELLERAPLVKVIYSSVKDLLSAFVGKEKKFNQPVLVKVRKDEELMRVGFITKNDLTGMGLPNALVAVYFPMSYSFSGNVYIIPANQLTPFKGSSAEVMKFVVSGGVTDVDGITISKLP